jgi:SAM-dependent methyltransferase
MSTTTASDNFLHHDIINAQKNQGLGLPNLKPYDAKLFWDTIGGDYFKRFVKREQYYANAVWIADRLKMVGEVESLLEIGCGFARLLPILIDMGACKRADGIDFSDSILESAKDYLLPPRQVWCEHIVREGDKWMSIMGQAIEDTWMICPFCKKDRPEAMEKALDSTNHEKVVSAIRLWNDDARSLGIEASSYDAVLSSETLQHMPIEDVELALRQMIRVTRRAIILVERWSFPDEHAEPHLWSHNYTEMFRKLGVNVVQTTTIGQGLQGVIALKRGT